MMVDVMGLVLLSIGLIGTIMLAMAVGTLVTGRCLRGSCGGLQPGAEVKVKGRLGGREWNGKCYGDNVAETVEVVGEATKTEDKGAVPEAKAPESDSIPF